MTRVAGTHRGLPVTQNDGGSSSPGASSSADLGPYPHVSVAPSAPFICEGPRPCHDEPRVISARLSATTQAIHASHSLGCVRGVLICWVCGGWTTTRPRNLTLPCPLGADSSTGAVTLARVRAGKLLVGCARWPLDASHDHRDSRVIVADPNPNFVHKRQRARKRT